ncbi:MAG: DASS family sodium-coupled anion symporter [Deltaproteobacteria bacterium]|nr:DASS family sodium-coupled anion symporter [Deltaproteobacteria bacterium]MDQ3301320.1 DASS family sodium-coupled anion symporter [Myxococcota bacterium]
MEDSDEQTDALADDTPGARFERTKRRVGLVLGPVLALALGLAPFGSASPALIGLMVLCVTWWLTEALPPAVVALMAAVGAVVLGLATPQVAFAAFGTPLLFLFVGSFFIAEAMRVHGLGDRIGALVARRARGRLSFLIAIAVAAFFLSMLMSNAASTAILLPIALAMAPAHRGDRFGTALVLVVAWGASIGGLGTPVGTPPNGFGINELRQRGLELGFVEWMAIGVPMGMVMLVGLVAIVAAFYGIRPNQPLPRDVAMTEARPWSRGEKAVVIVFCVAIIGWLAPTISSLLPSARATAWLAKHLTEEVVALTAGCLLFVLPGHGVGKARRPALTWSEATRIEWGVILLFGGGVLLGTLGKSTGLAEQWGRELVDATGASSTWTITALVTATSIILSEATSNTATASMMAPLAGALAVAAGAAPIPAVLGATMGASFGFMMPISTAPNAMAYATRRVTVGQMVRTGIVFDVIGFLLIIATLRVMCPLMGWT